MDQEYISRDELLADLRLARSLTPGLPYEGPMAKIVDAFFDMIATYPAADVAPVKHAHWIENPTTGGYTCSACGRVCADDHTECPYCHCGAKMY